MKNKLKSITDIITKVPEDVGHSMHNPREKVGQPHLLSDSLSVAVKPRGCRGL